MALYKTNERLRYRGEKNTNTPTDNKKAMQMVLATKAKSIEANTSRNKIKKRVA